MAYKDDDYVESSHVTLEDWKIFVAHVERLAKGFVLQFFGDKSLHCGGPLPIETLLAKDNLDIVMRTEFGGGLDVCYRILGFQEPPEDFHLDEDEEDEKEALDDIDLEEDEHIDYSTYQMVQILGELKKLGVPKDMQAGMALVYLKFCKGYKLPDKLPQHTHLDYE